jgi:ABC-type antimicrobial peptide transport system permease subunit
MYFELRASGNPLSLANTVRRLVHEADPQLPVANLTTQVRCIDSTIAPERTFASLCTCFGVLALLIASIGLYGTMAYAVARRTNEIGIRMALGAERRRVVWMVLREVLALCLIGLVVGFGIALETSRFVASFLFGVRPADPFSFGLSAAILIACALAAGYAPAWRASRIDPMQALRHE